jgi:hypothetical protein
MHYSYIYALFIDRDLLYRGALLGRFDCILSYVYYNEQASWKF